MTHEIAFGWEPDFEDPTQRSSWGLLRDRNAETDERSPLYSASGPLPNRLSLLPYFPEPIFQGIDPSCVGQTVAAGIQIAKRAKGESEAPLPSRQWIWNMSRHQHQDPDRPLQITGTHLRQALKVSQKHGYPTEKQWPYDPDATETWKGRTIQRREARPPLSVVRQAVDQRGPQGYYRISRLAPFKSFQQAIAARTPIALGMLVDEAFQDPDGPNVVDHIRPTPGLGHAMLMVGYERIDNQWYGECLNWWRGWRKPLVHIRADVLELSYDRWVFSF